MAQPAGEKDKMSDKPAIILVAPQLGENIGFVARSMGNFGFRDLRIISPRDGWPNKAAEATAAKAIDIIHNAKIFADFKKAVSDLTFLYASTARSRDCNKESIISKDLHTDILKSNTLSNKVGIVFGPERSGLDNEIISYANKILYIPTNNSVPSINLAMATNIICYELADASKTPIPKELATQSDVNNLLDHLENMLDKAIFYKSLEKKEKITLNIRNIFKRIPNLTPNEISTLIGAIKSLFEYHK